MKLGLVDLDGGQDWPPFRTLKEVRRLTNEELIDIAGGLNFLLGFYVHRDQPSDPVTQDITQSLGRLNREIDRRLHAGVLHIDELGSDENLDLFSVSRSRPWWRHLSEEAFLDKCAVICSLIGAVCGFLYFAKPGFKGILLDGLPGALVGFFVGAMLPAVPVAVWRIFSAAFELVRLVIRFIFRL
jgi:hypothetical protein